MIIDSRVYNGSCSCGRSHTMSTRMAVVEAGCLNQFEEYVQQCDLSGFRTVVYDANTYNAAGMICPSADLEIILDPENLHANEHGVALLMEQLTDNGGYLVAVGSGTVHDIVRYCAYQKGIPFVSCPTAASVDGFCSGVAAMTWEGAKKTLNAVSPILVVADLNVITQAPAHLARSGFGDMIGKYVALTDWRIAHALTGEFYCERIARITEEATQAVLDSAEGIASGDAQSYEKLTYGLLLSGIAMQMFGNSRPASGAEHHISHCIEMQPEGLGISSDALHGEKVGVGTLMAIREYRRLAQLPAECWGDYPGLDPLRVREVFGDSLSRQIFAENEKNAAKGITGQQIRNCLDTIRQEIARMPDPQQLEQTYRSLGVKATLEDIQVPQHMEQRLLADAPMVRNRLTLMRLRSGVVEK